MLDFFRTSTGHLLRAAEAAGVSHYVALSVVGSDRIRDSGYLHAKHAQEGMIEAGGVPYTVLRATQFFEFLKAIADGGRRETSSICPLSSSLSRQTMWPPPWLRSHWGSRRTASSSWRVRKPLSMAEFIQSFLSPVGDKRKVIPDPDTKYFGAVLDKDGLAPKGQFIAGRIRFADWVRA